MPFTLDAAIILKWYFSGPFDTGLDVVMERFNTGQAFVPAIWWYETRTILLAAEADHKIDASDTAGILEELSALPIEIEAPGHSDVLMALARKHTLLAPDAACLELALRRNLPLATLSPALARAAADEGLEILAFPG